RSERCDTTHIGDLAVQRRKTKAEVPADVLGRDRLGGERDFESAVTQFADVHERIGQVPERTRLRLTQQADLRLLVEPGHLEADTVVEESSIKTKLELFAALRLQVGVAGVVENRTRARRSGRADICGGRKSGQRRPGSRRTSRDTIGRAETERVDKPNI